MTPDNSIFRPHYRLPAWLMILVSSILFFGLFCIEISAPARFPSGYWYVMLVCGLWTSLLPFLTIREVRFANDMIIRRFFLPDVFVKHREAFTIEAGAIHVKKLKIRLGQLENIEQLQGMIQAWSARQTLKAVTRNPKAFQPIFPSRGHGAYAGFWGLVFAVIVTILGASWPNIDPRWPTGITFFTVYFLFVYIIPFYL